MIFVPSRNLYLPSRFKQQGTIGHFQSTIAAAGVGVSGFVEFSFASVLISSTGAGDQQARIVFRRNGNIAKFTTQGGTVPIGTWWSEAPETEIGDLYEVGYTNHSGDPYNDVEAAVEDAFVQINTIRQWGLIDTAPPGPVLDALATFGVGLLGESTFLDTAIVRIQADEEI